MDPEPEAAGKATRPGYQGYRGDPADNQAVFRFVAEHLLQQRRKSQALPTEGQGTPLCLFRGPGGLMCAAGCLVPDADYDPEWEDEGEIGSSENGVTSYFSRRGFDLELLVGLQQLHDNEDVEDWPGELQSTAQAFGLCSLQEPEPQAESLGIVGNQRPLPPEAIPLP